MDNNIATFDIVGGQMDNNITTFDIVGGQMDNKIATFDIVGGQMDNKIATFDIVDDSSDVNTEKLEFLSVSQKMYKRTHEYKLHTSTNTLSHLQKPSDNIRYSSKDLLHLRLPFISLMTSQSRNASRQIKNLEWIEESNHVIMT
ncbi:hypothetical protein CDAR_523671 [Caerostris darwini]|uniref:Uncharacterized protein n=1 Tax=Caerostris darwini TaxID=1538125 RepID=A0AAV4SXF2_9ARAC|nr:hypothetical protein CDAR_523671 [Caerostris darwini]